MIDFHKATRRSHAVVFWKQKYIQMETTRRELKLLIHYVVGFKCGYLSRLNKMSDRWQFHRNAKEIRFLRTASCSQRFWDIFIQVQKNERNRSPERRRFS